MTPSIKELIEGCKAELLKQEKSLILPSIGGLSKDGVLTLHVNTDKLVDWCVAALTSIASAAEERTYQRVLEALPTATDERKSRDTGDYNVTTYEEKQGYNAAVRQIRTSITQLSENKDV